MLKIATLDEKSSTLTIVLEWNAKGKESTSGKTIVMASSHGNAATPIIVKGQPLLVGCNAFVKK